MQFYCPFCQNPTQVTEDPPPADIDCEVCGSRFPSEPDRTVEYELGQVVHFAHFELLEEVGKGAYGSVWRARDTRLDRIVAVKIPRRDRLTPEEADRFLMEAQAAAQLRHQGIVSIHDTGHCGTTVYIATDFVDGMTLDIWMETRLLSPRNAAELCAQVADALHHAHESGIIHRDVKPSNIIVDQQDHPWITDFGLAKRESVDTTIAIEGSLLGTPAYMSPEQARGDAHWADRRSDIYSLGVILFQMLTGERPFRGSRDAILRQVLESEAPHSRRLNSNVPEDLDTICMKCLEKQPAARYNSASELADELRRFLRGEPIKARPITRTKRVARWCRRNPLVAGLAASLLIAMAAGISSTHFQSRRANQNARTAVTAAADAGLAAASAERAKDNAEQYLYVASINLVQQADELSDPNRMLEILNRFRPANQSKLDRRGFAWHYWRQQADRWSKTLDCKAAVYGVAMSQDGAVTATCDESGTIYLFNTLSGKLIKELNGHGQRVFAIQFSPVDDNLLVSVSGDRTLRFWDVSQGVELDSHPLKRSAFAIDFSDDGGTLVLGDAAQNVQIWGVANRTCEKVLSGHIDFVYDVDISSDGKLIASGGLDRDVRIWDAKTGEPLHVLKEHVLEVWGVEFTPDSRTLVSGGDVSICLWDAQSGELQTKLGGHADRLRSVAISPDGKLLATSSHDRSIRFWDLTAESQELQVPDRKTTRRDNYFFELMRLPNDGFPTDVFKGHAGHVTDIAWSTNGKTLVSSSTDGTAKLWDISELDRRVSLNDHLQTVNVVSVSNDGRTLISGSNDRTARLWDLATMKAIGQPISHDRWVFAATFSPDGKNFATGSSGGTVTLGSLTGSDPLRLNEHEGGVAALSFSPDSKHLASASHDGKVNIWDVATAQRVGTYLEHDGRVQAVVFLDDDLVATAGSDKVIRIWNIADRSTIRELPGHTQGIWALALSPDRKLLASVGYDRTLRIWNLESKERRERVIDAHAEPIRAVAFCSDGKTLATAGDDKIVKLWDINTWEPKTTFKAHESKIWSLSFSPSGEQLFSSSLVIRVWDAPKE